MKRFILCGILLLLSAVEVRAAEPSEEMKAGIQRTLAKRRQRRLSPAVRAAREAAINEVYSGDSYSHVGPRGGVWHYNSHGNKSYYKGK